MELSYVLKIGIISLIIALILLSCYYALNSSSDSMVEKINKSRHSTPSPSAKASPTMSIPMMGLPDGQGLSGNAPTDFR